MCVEPWYYAYGLYGVWIYAIFDQLTLKETDEGSHQVR